MFVLFFKRIFQIGLVAFFLIFSVGALEAQEDQSENAQALPYVLGPGDLINIVVYEEPQLSFQVRLGESGVISYPFIGEVQIAGKTAIQIENTIKERLITGEFLIQPEVTVNVVAFRPFFVDGAVNRPGSYPFEPGLTLRKAISIAGGFTERASRSNITVLRDSAQVTLRDNLLETPLRPDDIITVAERFF